MLVDGRSTIGVVEETLQPIGYRVEGLFVITGPFGSGRSTAMRTAVQSAIAARPGDKAYLFSGGNSALLDAIDWDAASRTADASAKLAADLTECILDPPQGTGERPERRLRSQWPAHSLDRAPNPAADPAIHRSDAGILIVVEDIAGFAGTPAENEIVRLLGLARNSDIPVIAEAETVTAHNAWQLLNELKTARAGLSLQPNDGDGMLLFRTDFPGAVRAEFPVGRGILVESGRTTRIQVALPRATSEITEGAIKYAGGAHRTTTRGATSGPGDGPAHSRTQFVGDETRARTGRRRAIR
jgi:DNA segregation ATPase FtsK/SpoIIIE, S-DNA-T family